MAKPFKTLADKMSPANQAKAAALKTEILNDISLQELRRALKLTQEKLAASLGIKQAAVSKIESQSDMFISTLRRCIEAMGGSLKIVAKIQDREVTISQFEDVSGDRHKKAVAS